MSEREKRQDAVIGVPSLGTLILKSGYQTSEGTATMTEAVREEQAEAMSAERVDTIILPPIPETVVVSGTFEPEGENVDAEDEEG